MAVVSFQALSSFFFSAAAAARAAFSAGVKPGTGKPNAGVSLSWLSRKSFGEASPKTPLMLPKSSQCFTALNCLKLKHLQTQVEIVSVVLSSLVPTRAQRNDKDTPMGKGSLFQRRFLHHACVSLVHICLERHALFAAVGHLFELRFTYHALKLRRRFAAGYLWVRPLLRVALAADDRLESTRVLSTRSRLSGMASYVTRPRLHVAFNIKAAPAYVPWREHTRCVRGCI